MAGSNFFAASTSTLDIALTDGDGLAVLAKCTGVPPTTASVFQHGCIILRTDSGTGNKALYENVGSSAVPSWNLIGDIAAGEITLADGKVLIGGASGVAAAQTLSGDVTTSNTGVTAIGAGKVLLSMLAAGVTPSHVVKYSGTVTWSGSGTTLASAVAGVAGTDIVTATIRVKPTQAAYLVAVTPTTDTLTFELSAANTSNDAQISYQVLRAAS